MKSCYFCKGKLVEQKVKVDFRWGAEAQDYRERSRDSLPTMRRAVF